MRIQIRENVFETNSSSVHTLVLCSDSEFSRWKNGEMFYDYQDECLRSVEDIMNNTEYNEVFIQREEADTTWDKRFLSYEDFFKGSDLEEYEPFDQTKTFGDIDVHAFGYYGACH